MAKETGLGNLSACLLLKREQRLVLTGTFQVTTSKKKLEVRDEQKIKDRLHSTPSSIPFVYKGKVEGSNVKGLQHFEVIKGM